LGIVLGLTHLAQPGSLRAQAEKDEKSEATKEKVAALIQQLGDPEFAKREAASKELKTVGVLALAALRNAAVSSEHLEIRRRAEQLVRAIAGPVGRVELTSPLFSPGLALAESKHPVHWITLDAQVNAKGEGLGKLALRTTPPNYDEFGDIVTGRETDLVERGRKDRVRPSCWTASSSS
jgi:hypothetical protein